MTVKSTYFDPRLLAPSEICRAVGARVQALRQGRSLRQADLARAAGVTLATVGRLERTGRVGFEVIVRVAVALGAEAELAQLFAPPAVRPIDEIVAQDRPKRRVRRRS
jgi:transcriptional regulator with XRE-family HTH domain